VSRRTGSVYEPNLGNNILDSVRSQGDDRSNAEDCSPIELLARIVWVGGEWEKVNLVVLVTMPAPIVGAFDASGKERGEPALLVAGFVSSAKDWDGFTTAWNKRLAEDNLTHFHAVDFAQCVGEFESWREQESRRKKLCQDLVDILRGCAYRKFGCIVENKAFQECVSDVSKEKFVANAYVLGGWSCAMGVSLWAKKERIKTPFKLVFEEGDIGKGKLTERLIRDGYAAPDFAPKRDRFDRHGNRVPGFVPLQASDWLAYEVFLDFKTSKGFSPPRSIRWAASEFDKMQGEISIFEADNLRQLDDLVEQSDDFLMRVLKRN
jgi:hypothetical protein